MDDTFNHRLTSLRPLHDWHKNHIKKGGVLFSTYASLKWFIRQHGDELADAGVLLRGSGASQSGHTRLCAHGLQHFFRTGGRITHVSFTNGCEG